MTKSTRHLVNAFVLLAIAGHAIYWFAAGRAAQASDLVMGLRAAQAVVGGEADIGVGTPYALIQKVKAPIRIFYQMSTLKFYPIVNAEFYKDWKDLDGQEIAVHARGSGTEAIMKLMAQKHGITYSNISYVPGAEVRAGALLQGNIKASIVDSTNKNLLEQKAPG